MQQQREGAFRLSGSGEMLQGSPSIFVRSLVGTPEKKQALTMALRSVGIPDERVGKFMEDLKILGATGRPTVVHGTRVPGTEINPIDIARATFGGALQQQQARMTLLRSAVNLISDAEIARIMAQPESLKLLQKMPGWKALDPRAALAAVIASQ